MAANVLPIKYFINILVEVLVSYCGSSRAYKKGHYGYTNRKKNYASQYLVSLLYSVKETNIYLLYK